MISRKIGIIGGGQLGKMLIEQNKQKIDNDKTNEFFIYSEEQPLTTHKHTWIKGNLNDKNGIINFGIMCDIITIEIENICVDALDILKGHGKLIYPDPSIIRLVQNKKLQKEFYVKNGYPTASFINYNILREINLDKIKLPCVNKLQIGGYDGHGVRIIKNKEQLFVEGQDFFQEPSIIEDFVKINKELSIIVARNHLGNIFLFPTVEMHFTSDHMLDYLISPAYLDNNLNNRARDIANKLATQLNLVGIMAIEFFLSGEQILINEISPRAHNSGHHTIDSMPNCSQYNLWYDCLMHNEFPTSIVNSDNITLMVNLLGSKTDKAISTTVFKTSFWSSKYNIHLYNKVMSFTNRKMGHLTYVTDLKWPTNLKYDSIENTDNSDWNLHLFYHQIEQYIYRMKHAIIIGSPIYQLFDQPLVSVIMGSISDLDVIKPCIEVLQEFKIPYNIKIVSAHRTPVDMIDFAKEIGNSSVKVIIAAAGGAAHLPGMVASVTHLPVIGIPIKSHISINGIDSLLSIVQMPAGVPVATMAIDGAKNAGLYATKILAINDERLCNLLKIFQSCLRENVDDMNKKLLSS